MMIRVMYEDGRFDMVKPQLLEKLLGTKRVSGFQRSHGWVVVGRDTLRNSRKAQSHWGLERRAC